MNDAESESQPLTQAEEQAAQEGRVRGERMSSVAHFVFALVLLFTAIILVNVSRGYSISKNLDFVTVYMYKKSAPDKGALVDKIKSSVGGASSWLNDPVDTAQCQDMTSFLFPSVVFTPITTGMSAPYTAAAVATGAQCNFVIYFKLGPMEEQLQIKNVTVLSTSTCAASSRYTVTLTAVPGASFAADYTAPILQLDASKAVTLANPNQIIGYNFKVGSTKWVDCNQRRQALSDLIVTGSECENGFSSPACTCVRAFTTRLTSWQARILPKPGGKYAMSEVLSEGVKRCLELRRTHDVREAVSSVYARSSALLVFVVAMFLNGLYNLLRAYGMLENTFSNTLFFLVYFVGVVLTGILDGRDGGTAMFETVLAIAFPAFLVHGIYLIVLQTWFRSQENVTPQPFLHPVTFDICLCALSLFTLVERGVVQLEYLMTDAIKCHAVSAVYIAIIWYYRYGRGHPVLESEMVQQAYLVLYAVGLVLPASGLVVPYPAKSCFEFHWLLPLAFTYVAFLNPGWAVHLRMENKLNGPANSTVRNFNAVAGFVFLLVGGLFVGYFLRDHLQIYGAKHFKYPVQGDPQDFVILRGMVAPPIRTNLA